VADSARNETPPLTAPPARRPAPPPVAPTIDSTVQRRFSAFGRGQNGLESVTAKNSRNGMLRVSSAEPTSRESAWSLKILRAFERLSDWVIEPTRIAVETK
jgi:hypothetical protein